MFESEFAKIEYIEKDNVVFHVWKKEAHYDDYRKPVTASLQMLREHKDSIFIVDARNGFEDTKEDVEWGFSFLFPEMSKTGCKTVWFIMTKVNETQIGEEMDMWTAEFLKYFMVRKVDSPEKIGV